MNNSNNMSNPNTDRDERVRQIRERLERLRDSRAARHINFGTYDADVSYLLSLFNDQVVRDFEWALRELADGFIGSNEREHFNHNARIVLGAIANDAATRMRDRCVEKVREMADEHGQGSKVEFDDCSMVAFHLRKAATVLESLTLEQGEQEK